MHWHHCVDCKICTIILIEDTDSTTVPVYTGVIAPNDIMLQSIHADELEKETIDKVIEDEITHKLSEDLLQSIEKKFQVDLER